MCAYSRPKAISFDDDEQFPMMLQLPFEQFPMMLQPARSTAGSTNSSCRYRFTATL
ncbi:MAG: hypothetical protein QOC77_2680, partial [Thermoleophilaceae bacterium]|nr:hypothetical protein [Thermoleophilaceae bacterium]